MSYIIWVLSTGDPSSLDFLLQRRQRISWGIFSVLGNGQINLGPVDRRGQGAPSGSRTFLTGPSGEYTEANTNRSVIEKPGLVVSAWYKARGAQRLVLGTGS